MKYFTCILFMLLTLETAVAQTWNTANQVTLA